MLIVLHLAHLLFGVTATVSATIEECLTTVTVAIPAVLGNDIPLPQEAYFQPNTRETANVTWSRSNCGNAASRNFAYWIKYNYSACSAYYFKLQLARLENPPAAVQPYTCSYSDTTFTQPPTGASYYAASNAPGGNPQLYCRVTGRDVRREAGNDMNRIVVTASSTTTFATSVTSRYYFRVVSTNCPAASGSYKKRQQELALGLPPVSVRCVRGTIACPAGRPGTWSCVEDSKLSSCGGCPGSAEAVDCSDIVGSDEVECVNRRCVVESCDSKHQLVDNACILSETSDLEGKSSENTRARERIVAKKPRALVLPWLYTKRQGVGNENVGGGI